MVLWDTSPPSPRSAGFPNKVAIPCPNNSSLHWLACRVASSTSLDSVTYTTAPYPPKLNTVSGSFQGQWKLSLVRKRTLNQILKQLNLKWQMRGTWRKVPLRKWYSNRIQGINISELEKRRQESPGERERGSRSSIERQNLVFMRSWKQAKKVKCKGWEGTLWKLMLEPQAGTRPGRALWV